MCESCEQGGMGRREFLALSGAAGAAAAMAGMVAAPAAAEEAAMPPRDKQPARVLAVFLYPPAEVVISGKMEDNWAPNQWFTWPGNQFQPEAQQQKFTAKIGAMAQSLGIEVEFAPEAVWQQAKVEEFIARARQSAVDAVLVVNFWNTLSKAAFQIA
ncbi:MAG: hypothetical protein KJZ87_19355, partial [Thermoguttaceae bacterium]|nr:hypothetical protein [Thermoguttaceae bacterium]